MRPIAIVLVLGLLTPTPRASALNSSTDAVAALRAAGLEVRMDSDRGVSSAIYDWRRVTPTTRKADGPEATVDDFLRRHQDALFAGIPVGLTPGRARVTVQTQRLRETRSGTQVIRHQHVDGVPVVGADVRTHLDRQGRVMSVLSGFDPRAVEVDTRPSLSADEALQLARQNLDRPGADRRPSTSDLMILVHEATPRLVYRTEILVWAPYGDWESYVDAHTGEILQTQNRVVFEKPVHGRLEITPPVAAPTPARPALPKGTSATGSGFVFPNNPLNNNPLLYGLREQTADMDVYRVDLPLPRLDGSGFLRGDYADVDNSDITRANEPSLVFEFSSEITNSNFHEVNIYWHVDTLQDYIQTTLGITNANNESQVLFAHQGEDDNSSYSPGADTIRFGDGGVDDSEDGEIVLHEYGHALHDDMAGGIGGGEAGAISEGFADYIACSFSDSPLEGEWDATSYNPGPPPFLRRVDNNKTYSDWVGQVHADGEIIAGAWWDLREALGRELADEITLESFFLVGPGVSMEQLANAAVQADQSIYGGAHVASIQTVFAAREILPGGYELIINHTPLPDTANTAGPYTVDIQADFSNSIQNAQLHWRKRGEGPTFTTTAMPSTGADTWSADIPGPAVDTIVQYYVTITDNTGVTQYDPQDAPNNLHNFDAGSPTPTLVSGLRASNAGQGVVVSWNSHAEAQASRFFVLRSVDGGPLTSLTPQGLTASSGQMEYLDPSLDLSPGADLLYRLEVESGGQRQLLPDETALKYTPNLQFALDQNRPNPFNPETTIRFVLRENGPASLRVYDVAGRLVKELIDGELTAGAYTETWNGRDERGVGVSSGTYYYRLVAQGFQQTRRMVLLK